MVDGMPHSDWVYRVLTSLLGFRSSIDCNYVVSYVGMNTVMVSQLVTPLPLLYLWIYHSLVFEPRHSCHRYMSQRIEVKSFVQRLPGCLSYVYCSKYLPCKHPP